MKVQELIQKLQELPPHLKVIITDDEGNGFRYLGDYSVSINGYNAPEKNRDIDIGILELTPELIKQHYSKEDLQPYPCVVLG